MTTPTADEILARLRAGNARYVNDAVTGDRRCSVRRGKLLEGQAPFAIILSCADSRVAPEIAFDTGLGELFVCRVAGNIANTCTIASVEFAVTALGTPVVVVLGHQSCGAVEAALAAGDQGPNLNHLLSHIEAAKVDVEADDVDTLVKANALRAGRELVARSSILRSAVEEGRLRIVPAYYALDDGSVSFLA